MKQLAFVLLVLLVLLFGRLSGMAESSLLEQAYDKAGTNVLQLKKAFADSPKEHRPAIEFLISYMPERDLKSLRSTFLLENTALAYQARETFPWGQAIPEEIFFNDVLPYATLNERRDNWRADFYKRFSTIVADCSTIEEAVSAINKNIKENLGVKYSTKRKKPDQSPYESMDIGLASCTGLSILLTDALRAVGIPARIAGTPMWTLKRGNHNWVEVFVGGEWKFTEHDNPNLNKAWFLKDAAAANTDKQFNKIYATSFKPADYWFPLVWDMNIRYVHAVEVSDYYKEQYAKLAPAKPEKGYPVSVRLFASKDGERVSGKISIVNEEGAAVASGKTAGPQDDMNNVLQFMLPEGTYKAVFEDKQTCRTVEFSVQSGEVEKIDLFLK